MPKTWIDVCQFLDRQNKLKSLQKSVDSSRKIEYIKYNKASKQPPKRWIDQEGKEMREQRLTFCSLRSIEDVDWKIREMGKYWERIKDIEIEYRSDGYIVSMTAVKTK